MSDMFRDSGVTAIEKLMERRGKFDYILLETTGLADPGNIAPLFWLDEGLGSSIFLDGIVTLVDAANIAKSLEDNVSQATTKEPLTVAHLQISHADVVVINKADLVSADGLEHVRRRVAGINGVARIVVAEISKTQGLLGCLLDLKAYESVDGLKTNERSVLDPVRTLMFTVAVILTTW